MDVMGLAVLPVQQDAPAVEIVEAAQQVDDGALARAGRADERDALAGAHVQVDVFQDVNALLVGEGDILKVHLAGDGRQFFGAGDVVDLDRLVHRLKDALQIGDVVDEGIVDVGEVRDRLPEAADVLAHGEDHAEADHLAAGHPVDAGDVEERQHDLRQNLAGEPDAVADVDRLDPRGAAGRREPLHDADVDLLPVEQLADAHAVDRLGQIGVVVAVLVALVLPRAALARLEQEHHRQEKRQAAQDDRRQQRVGRVHEDHDEHEAHDLQNHVDDAVGQDVGHGVDVVDHAHEDLARRTAVVIAERQLLQMRKQVLSDVVDDLLADVRHEPRADRREHDAQQDDAHEDRRHPADHGDVLVRHGVVEHPFGDLRDEQRGDRRQRAQRERQEHLALVAADVHAGALQVLPLKGGFQLLVDFKRIARHPSPPPRRKVRSAKRRSGSSSRAGAPARRACRARRCGRP